MNTTYDDSSIVKLKALNLDGDVLTSRDGVNTSNDRSSNDGVNTTDDEVDLNFRYPGVNYNGNELTSNDGNNTTYDETSNDGENTTYDEVFEMQREQI